MLQIKKCNTQILRLLIFLLGGSLLIKNIAHAQQIAVKATDTTEILNIIEKGTKLTEKFPKEALTYFTKSFENSKALNFDKGVALSSARLGRWYFGNDVGKSIEMANNAILFFDKNTQGSVDNIADMHLLLAEAYDEQGKKRFIRILLLFAWRRNGCRQYY